MFTKGSVDDLVILVVYVDDIIITGTDLCEIVVVKAFLHNQFKIKDLGKLNYFLGIEVCILIMVYYFIRKSLSMICF